MYRLPSLGEGGSRAVASCFLFALASTAGLSCTSDRIDAIAIGERTSGSSGGETPSSTGMSEGGTDDRPETGPDGDGVRDVFVSGGIQPPLHTAGNRIVDSNGKTVRLKGVNWYGLESAYY